jgi:hypothetical protein
VPRAEFQSYYGRPVLKEPVWHTPDVPGYLFLGGLASASSLLAAFAQLAGDRELPARRRSERPVRSGCRPWRLFMISDGRSAS